MFFESGGKTETGRSRPIRKANTIARTKVEMRRCTTEGKIRFFPNQKRFKNIKKIFQCNTLFVNRPTRFAGTRASICIINWCVCVHVSLTGLRRSPQLLRTVIVRDLFLAFRKYITYRRS